MQQRRIYVTVAGNIGVGKSTLVGILAEEFAWQPYYELVQDHPYLDDYYKEMPRWGFHAQVYFLSQRYEQHQEISDNPLSVCQDRSMHEDYEIFVKGLLEQGILSPRDFQTYRRLFQALSRSVVQPDLLIYLRASVETLQGHINGRDRPYEREIPDEYLATLNRRYELWMERWETSPVITLDCNRLDFAHREEDRQEVIRRLREYLGQ
ncbi:MAG: deoxynucleoside kinase [Chloroflexia bacterium]|nr:deoxynucleoside kinase [Chloroflexia bacterium]